MKIMSDSLTRFSAGFAGFCRWKKWMAVCLSVVSLIVLWVFSFGSIARVQRLFVANDYGLVGVSTLGISGLGDVAVRRWLMPMVYNISAENLRSFKAIRPSPGRSTPWDPGHQSSTGNALPKGNATRQIYHPEDDFVRTALDEYVLADDGHYHWSDTGIRMHGLSPDLRQRWEGHLLNLTSQKWLDDRLVSRSIWWHYLLVIFPASKDEEVSKGASTAIMWVTGGSNSGKDGDAPEPPKTTDLNVLIASTLAMETGCPAAILYQVPNQPLIFTDDPKAKSRKEDAAVAFTWHKFLMNTSNPEILLRFPMTKAVVKAMDAAQDYSSKLYMKHAQLFNTVVNVDDPESTLAVTSPIKSFIVAGASKRGWTAWMVGAVDRLRKENSRVKGIIPIVMDELNFRRNVHHHFRAYGGWSFAFKDYFEMNITRLLDDPHISIMEKLVDPYSYRSRLDLPKLVVCGSGDEFFLPDDQQWWWDHMPEPKHLLMVPNADHTLATGISEVLSSTSTWIWAIAKGFTLPQVSWQIDNTAGTIQLQTNGIVKKASVWTARSCNGERRDFRLLNIDKDCSRCGWNFKKGLCLNAKVVWKEHTLQPIPGGVGNYSFQNEHPTVGWSAAFVNVAFDVREMYGFQHSPYEEWRAWPFGKKGWMEITSGVNVAPNTFPFPPCRGHNCTGKLV